MTDETRAKVREALRAARVAQGRVRQELYGADATNVTGDKVVLLSRQEGLLEAAIAALETV